MTNRLQWFLGLLLLGTVATILVLEIEPASTARANVASFMNCFSVTATTSPTYSTPGKATTTLTLPGGTGCAGTANLSYDSAYVDFFIIASASPVALPLVVAQVEHSRNGIDWYTETVPLVSNSTTTTMSGNANTLKWIIASSTADYGASSFSEFETNSNATSTRYTRSFPIATPTAYTRVIFTNPTNGGNYDFYAELSAKRQQQ